MCNDSSVLRSTIRFVVDDGKIRPCELLHVFAGFCDRGCSRHELQWTRYGSLTEKMITCGDQPPNQESEVAPEYALQRVRLVHHQRRQGSHEVPDRWQGQVRHQPCVTHVGRHDDDAGVLQHLFTVFNRHRAIDTPNYVFIKFEQAGHFLPSSELVRSERFERVEHEGAASRFEKHLVENERPEYKTFTGRGPGGYHDVFATAKLLKRLRLMCP